MSKRVGVLSTWILCVLAVAGCGSEGERGSPAEALAKAREALESGDKTAFMQCVDGTPEEIELFEELADVVIALNELVQISREKFGEEAYRKMDVLQEMRDGFLLPASVDESLVDIDGDTATVRSPGRDRPIHLVRKDGTWRITAADLHSGPATVEETFTALHTMRQAVEAARSTARSSDAKPEDVEKRLSREAE